MGDFFWLMSVFSCSGASDNTNFVTKGQQASKNLPKLIPKGEPAQPTVTAEKVS